jgi:hypothetical protein
MAFADLRQKYEQIAEIHPDVVRSVADRVAAVVRAQIAAGTDPFGGKWAPLKKGSGTRLASFAGKVKTKISGDVISIVVDDFKAIFHHEGTAKVPTSQILPDGEMPDSWRRVIGDEFHAELLKAMGQ